MNNEEEITKLGPYLGALGKYEGEYEELPPEREIPIPEGLIEEMMKERGDEEGRERDIEQDYLDAMRRKAAELGVKGPETYREAQEFELFLPRLERKGELEELERRARLEEAKTRMSVLKEARPSKLKKFLKGVGRTWKGVKEAAGPRGKVSREFYVPRASRSLYVPGVPRWKPTTEFMPAGEAHRPQLGTLRRVGTPPASPRISVPFRDVERFEGIGTALGRLRRLEVLPSIDQAVFQEIHANGDIDTPSHVRKEVKQLGFSSKEIDTSLKRLRNLGLIAPTGNKVKGEQELMVVGG